MSEFATIQLEGTCLRVSGDLNFATTEMLLRTSSALLEQSSELNFDLEQVSFSNSAGLALMLEWMRYAKHHNKPIVFRQVPPQLLAVAKIAGVDEILGVAEARQHATDLRHL